MSETENYDHTPEDTEVDPLDEDLPDADGVDDLPEELVSRCVGDEAPPTEAQQAETFEEVDDDE